MSFPDEDVNFERPTASVPLALFASQIAAAVISISARPAYDDGTVEDWLRYLARSFELEVGPASELSLASGLRGVVAAASQMQDGTALRFVLFAFEDGGRLVIAQAMCPEELWPSFGESMRAAILSLALDSPQGHLAPLLAQPPTP